MQAGSKSCQSSRHQSCFFDVICTHDSRPSTSDHSQAYLAVLATRISAALIPTIDGRGNRGVSLRKLHSIEALMFHSARPTPLQVLRKAASRLV